MVETRQQERSMAEQLEEMRLAQAKQSADLKTCSDSWDARFTKLETTIFTYFSQMSAPGKQPMEGSYSGDPHSGDSSRPPDPPDPAHTYRQRADLNTYGQDRSHGLTSRLSKISFPLFDGSELRDRIYQCDLFFGMDNTPPEQRVRLAAMHLRGKALQWHYNFMTERFGIFPSWTDYIVAISSRFSTLFDDPLAELVALKQGSDDVETFLDKFENAKTRIVLPEAHALSIFLTNLHQHLALHVRQFEPTTLAAAAKIAKLHESALAQTPIKNHRAPFNPNHKPNSFTPYKPKETTPLLPNPDPKTQNTKPTFIPRSNTDTQARKYTYQEMQDRHAKGLCMFCDEPFTPGHQMKHKRSHIYVMEGDNDDSDDEDQLQTAEITAEDLDNTTPTVSVNALSGSASFNCMRVVGQYGKKKLHILIDLGSTHNFLDVNVANALGCKLEPLAPMTVAASNGCDLTTKFKCSKFSWTVQGYTFTTEIPPIPLHCGELVLGVQWLCTLGPILWEFLNLRMEFQFQGIKHVLRGVSKSGYKVINGGNFNKLLLQQPQIALLRIREIDNSSDDNTLSDDASLSFIAAEQTDLSNDPILQQLLQSFADIFEEPVGLPPFREGFDHRVPLETGANPVNLRPYRYSSLQKDAIDSMIKDMLAQGTIQCSSSPYASPIVLVKKKDGTWRLSVDYRGLNKQTIKDKYPIPLLEDLLDELGGACFFSKLDLRAGFHQIRMTPDDVYKTAFKTHSGHYEYLVMPFGLSNAPCTFQGLMNHIFQEISRKFLLVLFDDILVYINTWEEHLQHLHEVFAILRQQQMYLKPSKCTFGATSIEYLGHIISAAGVSTDPKKIADICKWPTPSSHKQL